MAMKVDSLTAGSGIQITGSGTTRAIACTVSPLTLQLDGATQAGATTLNFVGNNASLSAGVLNLSRMAWQDKVVPRTKKSRKAGRASYSGMVLKWL